MILNFDVYFHYKKDNNNKNEKKQTFQSSKYENLYCHGEAKAWTSIDHGFSFKLCGYCIVIEIPL